MASPHEVLGVDADADERAIVAAYRRRVKEAHPDHGGSRREFRRVTEAYDALTSPDRPAADPPRADPGSGARPGHARAAREGRAGAGARAPPGGTAGGADPAAPTDVEVEYLDYEALADHGWSLDDGDLFEKAAAESLDPGAFGRFVDDLEGSLLEAAERSGFSWPFSCRGGACANCAVAVVDGDLEMPANHVLPEELYDRGIRLSCIGRPTTDELRVVYNVKHLPDLQELLLPNHPFQD